MFEPGSREFLKVCWPVLFFKSLANTVVDSAHAPQALTMGVKVYDPLPQ